MKYLFSLLALVFSLSAFGQTVTITSNGDTLHSHLDSLSCHNPCATLVGTIYPQALAGTSVYSVSSIPYTPDPFYLGTPATVFGASMLSYDDNFGDSVTMPFSFSFFCKTWNKIIIGTNGNISMNPANTNVYDPWPISGPLPGSNCTATEDAVMGPWNDLYPPNGGTIKYAVYGTAPNRRFVISWDSVHLFISGTCNGFTSEQIVLHETTNIIDVFIASRIPCTAWNSGYAVTGIENLAGTIFYNPPGENGTTFTATNEGWRFTPSAPTPWVVGWYDSTGTRLVSSTDSITECPSVATKYIFKATNASSCGTTSLILDTIKLVPVSTVRETFTNPTVCGECNGTLKFTGLDPLSHVSVSYMKNGIAQTAYIGTAASDSTFVMSGLCAAVYTNIIVTGGSCSAYATNATLVNPPPIPANFYLTEKLGCSGDQINVYNTSSPAGYNNYWNWGDGSPIDSSGAIPDTHLYNDSLLGYVATYTVTLTYESYHNPACATTHDTVISFNHPLSAAFTADNAAVCVSVPVNFTNTSIANGPSYFWDFGDGFTDTTMNPSHAYSTGGDYYITLVTSDTIGCHSLPATSEVTVVQVDIHASVADTSVCLVDSMHMLAYPTVLPAGEVSYYIYWSPSGNLGEDSTATPKFFGIGTYTYTVNLVTTGPAVCMASDNETIHSYPPVTLTGLTASPSVIAYGSSILLNADGAVYYTWSPDNGTLSNLSINNPVATPTDTTTTYTVYGTNLYGCLDSAKIIVNLDIDHLEDMPSGFTPDGDGLNDVFRISHLKYKKLLEFRVYNRWGQEVFSTNNPEVGWDGKFHGVPQDVGVYNYQIIIAEADGTQKVYKGSVTLIR